MWSQREIVHTVQILTDIRDSVRPLVSFSPVGWLLSASRRKQEIERNDRKKERDKKRTKKHRCFFSITQFCLPILQNFSFPWDGPAPQDPSNKSAFCLPIHSLAISEELSSRWPLAQKTLVDSCLHTGRASPSR